MRTVPTNPIVEAQIGGVWTDITPYCRLESADSGGGIQISRGIPNEGNVAEPTSVDLVVNNRDGRFSMLNPTGPYWGLLKRNLPIRVGMDRYADSFNRTAVASGLGFLPDRVIDGATYIGPKWNLSAASQFSVNGTEAVITGASGYKLATFGTWGDSDTKIRFKMTTRDTTFGIVTRLMSMMQAAPAGIDPTFETSVAGWTASSGTVTRDGGQFHHGAYAARMQVTGSPTDPSLAAALSTTTMYLGGNALPGSTYRMRTWVRTSAGVTVRQSIQWYDEDGVTSRGTTQQDTAVTANTWTMLQSDFTVPVDGGYARPVYNIVGTPVAGTSLWIDDLEIINTTDVRWLTATIVPGTNDILRINKALFNGGVNTVADVLLGFNVLVDTWYYMRAQQTGQRTRMKLWKDGDPEPRTWQLRWFDHNTWQGPAIPTTGEVGVVSTNGTATVTIDSIQVDHWRAHAEITKLPNRWDLSREDRWVPVEAKGMLRRLGQGRKALQSALSLHLNAYALNSYGWWPLESDSGDTVGNSIQGGYPGRLSGVSFSSPEMTGTFRLPGASGIATLDDAASLMTLNVQPHTNTTGKQTFLWFMRLPALPASETTPITLYSLGTVRTWTVGVTAGGGLKVIGKDRAGATIVDQSVAAWSTNPDRPTGCWFACTLYLLQNGGNVEWALNFHRPGSTNFWTNNGSFAGTVGTYTGIQIKSNSVVAAAGNLQVGQIMHYADDLPFVTYDFAKAAIAYESETSAARFLRLCANAGISATTMGHSATDVMAMGYQLPGKLTELLEECAAAEAGFVLEGRDDFELQLVTRASLRNRYTRPLDIELGHLSEPLEPDPDDQQTRNDITISRRNGGFARAVQETGPLNVNSPEVDVEGVGTYDAQEELVLYTDAQCGSHANARVSRGTLKDPRYPVMHADLTSTAYRTDLALTAALLIADVGDHAAFNNPMADYTARRMMFQGYTEAIDLYDWDLTFASQPGAPHRIGVVNLTTRVDTESHVTNASFVSGADTRLVSNKTGPGRLWVTVADDPRSFPFQIEVDGVQFMVEAVGNVLNANGDFEAGTTGWAASSGNVTLAKDRQYPFLGRYSLRMTAAAGGTDGAVQDASGAVVTVPGDSYLVSGWMRPEVTATDLRVAVDWYQSNNSTFISTSLPTLATPVGGGWTHFSAVVVAPALAARARLRIRNVFAGATRLWADQMRIIPVTSYSASPQTLSVTQVPLNNMIKTIPAGKPIRLAFPWRVGW